MYIYLNRCYEINPYFNRCYEINHLNFFVVWKCIDMVYMVYHTSLEKSPLASCRTVFDIKKKSSDHLSGIEVLITTIHQLSH